MIDVAHDQPQQPICWTEDVWSGPFMKVREVLRTLHHDGWIMARQKGSHRQFKHLSKRKQREPVRQCIPRTIALKS